MAENEGFWEELKRHIAIDNPWSLDGGADLTEYLPIPISIVDATGYYVFVNKRFCEMTAYSRDELLDKTYWDITAKPDVVTNSNANHALQTFGTTGWFKREYVRKDGLHVPVLLKVRRFLHLGKYFYLAIIDLQ